MSEHTELPWNVSDIDEYGGYDCMTDAIHVGPIDIDAMHYGQLNAGDDDYDKEKMLADARLISVSVNNHERLVDMVAELDELICYYHGCFPLDRVTEKQRRLNDTMVKARALLAAMKSEKKGEL